MIRKLFALSLILFLANTVEGQNTNDPNILVNNAWSPEAPPVAKVLAGYMTIVNKGSAAQTLISAKSPESKAVKLHQTLLKDGVAGMEQQQAGMINPGDTLLLTPGGYHLMLMQPTRAFRSGDTIPVELVFSNSKSIDVMLEVHSCKEQTQHHLHQHQASRL